MARDWEVTYNAGSVDFVDNPWLVRKRGRARQLAARKFYPSDLGESDMRSGTNRRYSDSRNLIYLKDELRMRNKDGLEGWQ